MLDSLNYVPPRKKEKKLSVVFRQGDGQQAGSPLGLPGSAALPGFSCAGRVCACGHCWRCCPEVLHPRLCARC